ncbi:uncharacterized protein J8A68_004884 [[Candida] subhashii]|uniref:Uncharacterized protein n=1 Tax=[Candida] subhashii TaxID=561895 RepID=A0A8J5QQ27_9ASCO|nr:uncharacterized protein J8A68_004884 [[Candida] subhashii]KAG7661615.1 hypothetical protein J8A68_004884 [[Candida] subhashii]
MAYVETRQPYYDPVISLVTDPNLNKDQTKSTELIRLIQNITERKVSKLCSSAFIILQTLDKLHLKLKSWEFLSLDYNSQYHFEQESNSDIKQFNTGVADKVLVACTELNRKISKISSDIDFISKSSRTLTPIDLISDSGTMLTSLILRIIKLKNELTELLSISYSKAKLILIGQELEVIMSNDDDEENKDRSTVDAYKAFISGLLRQLNDAIDQADNDAKYECLAMINDMERMFEKFKLERMVDSIEQSLIEETALVTATTPTHDDAHLHPQQRRYSDVTYSEFDFDSSDSDINTSVSQQQHLHAPMVHSITRNQPKDSLSAASTSSSTHKSTITDELPYLMTAFSSVKNMEEDISHYTNTNSPRGPLSPTSSSNRSSPPSGIATAASSTIFRKSSMPLGPSLPPNFNEQQQQQQQQAQHRRPFFHKASHLPQSSLYSESSIVGDNIQARLPNPYVLTSNSSFLSKLGIRPQVISVPSENATTSTPGIMIEDKKVAEDDEDKENQEKGLRLLTTENLRSHEIMKLDMIESFDDDIDDYVE